MEPSYRYFENKACKYYPCHKGTEHINCLFCYCPLYPLDPCPGAYNMIEAGGKTIKECTDCMFPHRAENYDLIIALLGG